MGDTSPILARIGKICNTLHVQYVPFTHYHNTGKCWIYNRQSYITVSAYFNYMYSRYASVYSYTVYSCPFCQPWIWCSLTGGWWSEDIFNIARTLQVIHVPKWVVSERWALQWVVSELINARSPQSAGCWHNERRYKTGSNPTRLRRDWTCCTWCACTSRLYMRVPWTTSYTQYIQWVYRKYT